MAQRELVPFWRSSSCNGETCTLCGKPADLKVGEEIMHDDPHPNRHNFTAYVCLECGNRLFYPYLFRGAPLSMEGTTADAEKAKFIEWFMANCPPDTIIGVSEWWAERIWRQLSAALSSSRRALEEARTTIATMTKCEIELRGRLVATSKEFLEMESSHRELDEELAKVSALLMAHDPGSEGQYSTCSAHLAAIFARPSDQGER